MTKAEVRKLDRLARMATLAIGVCQRCGSTRNLQTSHTNGRSMRSVRWEPLNLLCLCASCHGWYTHYRTAGDKWMRSFMGEDAYEELDIRTKKLSYSLTEQEVIDRWRECGWKESDGIWTR